jgi:hypothetical protein
MIQSAQLLEGLGRQQTKNRKVSHNREFERDEVIGVYPVLCCLPYKRALGPASGGIALHRMATSTNKVIQAGEFDDDCIPVILIKRALLEVVLNERLGKGSWGLFLQVWAWSGGKRTWMEHSVRRVSVKRCRQSITAVNRTGKWGP